MKAHYLQSNKGFHKPISAVNVKFVFLQGKSGSEQEGPGKREKVRKNWQLSLKRDCK